ncbi:tetratricopeptide repeat protein [bacterium]|nr:tetratricopeptide repeat protein [bacterium]
MKYFRLIHISLICTVIMVLSGLCILQGTAFSMGSLIKRHEYNLFLITIDTIRADHLGCYGYKNIKTPNIDKLASEGAIFSQTISPVPITLPSHSSIMTGLYPVQHGVRNNGNFSLSRDAVTIAEIMRENGYQTGACVGSFILDSIFGLDQGFDYYDDNFTPGKKRSNFLYNERKAGDVTRIGIQWLEKHKDNKFFLWLHYYDPHSPYFPPFPFSVEYRDRPYDGEIAYVDVCLGELFKQMDDMGLMDHTIVILVGDHGEGLGDHNEDTHTIFIYDATLRVPFIIRAPDLIKEGTNVNALVSTVDILPTVIDQFGLKPLKGLAGKTLMPLMNGQAKQIHSQILCESLFPELNFGWSRLEGIRTPEWKYIYAPSQEIYQIIEDPGEKKNVFQKGSSDHEGWKVSLDRLKNDYPPASWAVQQARLNPETEQRLKSLGYVWTRAEIDKEEDKPRPDPKELIQVMNYMDNGISYILLESYHQAIEEFQKIVRVDPQNTAAYFHLGSAYEEKGDLDQAEIFFRKTLELNPDHAYVYNRLGLIQYKRGNLELALAEFKKSLEIFEYVEVYYNISLVYEKQRKIENAIAAIEKSLELDPDYVESWNQLGSLYLTQNNLQEAAKYFKKALYLDPVHVKAHVNLGLVYSSMGRTEDAIKQFTVAAELDPNSSEAHNNLGSLYLGQKRFDQAMPHLQKALDIRPGYQKAIINMGMLHAGMNHYEKAEDLFQKALEIDSNCVDVYIQLGFLYMIKQEYDRAIAFFKRMQRLQPKDPRVYIYMGKAYYTTGQKDEAIKAWQKALELNPSEAGVHLNLGNVYFETGDFQKAQEEWRLAFAGRHVDIPTHLLNIGMFYFQSEQFKDAVNAWQKASELKPDDFNLHYNLALAYFKQGLYEPADLELKICLRIKPDSQDARMLRERIRMQQE